MSQMHGTPSRATQGGGFDSGHFRSEDWLAILKMGRIRQVQMLRLVHIWLILSLRLCLAGPARACDAPPRFDGPPPLPETNLAYSADNHWLAVRAEVGPVRVWDLRTGTFVRHLHEEGTPVRALSFLPTDSRLLTLGSDGTVRIWDVTEQQPARQTYTGPLGLVVGLRLSSDGQSATFTLPAGSTQTVKLSGVKTDSLHQEPPCKLPVGIPSPSGPFLASVQSEASGAHVALWDTQQCAIRWEKTLRQPTEVKLSFSPSGRLLSAHQFQQEVWIWDTETGAERFHRDPSAPPSNAPLYDSVTEIGIAADDVTFAVGYYGGEVALFRSGSDHEIRHFQGLCGPVAGLAFDRSGSILAGQGSAEFPLTVWDVESGKARWQLPSEQEGGVDGDPHGLSLSLHGYHGEEPRQWDIRSGHRRCFRSPPKLLGRQQLRMRFGPDGKRLILFPTGESWDLQSHHFMRPSPPADTELDYNPDGLLPASEQTLFALTRSKSDARRAVYELTSGALLRRFQNGESFRHMLLLPDGTLLGIQESVNEQAATTKLALWSAQAKREVLRLPLNNFVARSSAARLSRDGRFLALCHSESPTWADLQMDGLSRKSRRQEVAVIDLKRLSTDAVYRSMNGACDDMAFAEDGPVIVTRREGSRIGVWRPRTKQQTVLQDPELKADSYTSCYDLWKDACRGGCATSLRLSTDGMSLASSQREGSITIWDLPSGRQRVRLPGFGNDVVSMEFSPNGKLLSSGHYSRDVVLWDLSSGLMKALLRSNRYQTESEFPVPLSPERRVVHDEAAPHMLVNAAGWSSDVIDNEWMSGLRHYRTLNLMIQNPLGPGPACVLGVDAVNLPKGVRLDYRQAFQCVEAGQAMVVPVLFQWHSEINRSSPTLPVTIALSVHRAFGPRVEVSAASPWNLPELSIRSAQLSSANDVIQVELQSRDSWFSGLRASYVCMEGLGLSDHCQEVHVTDGKDGDEFDRGRDGTVKVSYRFSVNRWQRILAYLRPVRLRMKVQSDGRHGAWETVLASPPERRPLSRRMPVTLSIMGGGMVASVLAALVLRRKQGTKATR